MPRIGTRFFPTRTLKLLRSISKVTEKQSFAPFSADGHRVIYRLPSGKVLLEQHYPAKEAAQSAIWTIDNLIEHLAQLSKEDVTAAIGE